VVRREIRPLDHPLGVHRGTLKGVTRPTSDLPPPIRKPKRLTIDGGRASNRRSARGRRRLTLCSLCPERRRQDAASSAPATLLLPPRLARAAPVNQRPDHSRAWTSHGRHPHPGPCSRCGRGASTRGTIAARSRVRLLVNSSPHQRVLAAFFTRVWRASGDTRLAAVWPPSRPASTRVTERILARGTRVRECPPQAGGMLSAGQSPSACILPLGLRSQAGRQVDSVTLTAIEADSDRGGARQDCPGGDLLTGRSTTLANSSVARDLWVRLRRRVLALTATALVNGGSVGSGSV
jgi:hypothetical protein